MQRQKAKEKKKIWASGIRTAVTTLPAADETSIIHHREMWFTRWNGRRARENYGMSPLGSMSAPCYSVYGPDGGQARRVEDLSSWAGDRRVTRADCSISLKQVVGCDENGSRTYSTRAATFTYIKQAKLAVSSVFLKCNGSCINSTRWYLHLFQVKIYLPKIYLKRVKLDFFLNYLHHYQLFLHLDCLCFHLMLT